MIKFWNKSFLSNFPGGAKKEVFCEVLAHIVKLGEDLWTRMV